MSRISCRSASAICTVAVTMIVTGVHTDAIWAQSIRAVPDGPIHEAFVPAVTGIAALEAIDRPPPPPIIEKIPATCDAEARWIKGYWAFDDEIDDFYWVGGTWRRPPRGHFWIDGFWHPLEEGWVWIRGFWSPVPADSVIFIEDPPPDPVEEDASMAPGRGYFWLAGYWGHQPGQGYVRFSGRWIEMDPHWVLVPASFTWRPEGYVFVPAYWDWPIESRGCTYQTVYVEPAARVVGFVYEPVVIVEPAVVINWTYSYYPNYVYFVHHHYHHHHDWWHVHYDVPTWWGWHSWWSLSWHDHWGVWWWWSNPGYPHPHFMTTTYAARIAPPRQKNVFKVKNVYAPKIVTVNGVVAPRETLKHAVKDKSKGKVVPVVAKTNDKKAGKERPVDKDAEQKSAPKADRRPDNDKDKIAKSSLRPTGNNRGNDTPDNNDQPPKPTKKQPGFVRSPGKNAKTTSDSPGRDAKDDEKSKGKSRPPVTVKGDRGGDTEPKVKGRPDDKSAEKSRPPVVSPGQMKEKDKDREKSREKPTVTDKPGRIQIVPPGGDKPKGKSSDSSRERKEKPDKPNDSSSGKKSGSAAPPIDVKPKERDKPKPPPQPNDEDRDDKGEKGKKKDKK